MCLKSKVPLLCLCISHGRQCCEYYSRHLQLIKETWSKMSIISNWLTQFRVVPHSLNIFPFLSFRESLDNYSLNFQNLLFIETLLHLGLDPRVWHNEGIILAFHRVVGEQTSKQLHCTVCVKGTTGLLSESRGTFVSWHLEGARISLWRGNNDEAIMTGKDLLAEPKTFSRVKRWNVVPPGK